MWLKLFEPSGYVRYVDCANVDVIQSNQNPGVTTWSPYVLQYSANVGSQRIDATYATKADCDAVVVRLIDSLGVWEF